MKRIQIFLAGAFIATGSLFAQSSDAEWQAGLARMKSLVQTDPGQASDEAEQLLKGKNKKNPELVIAVARVFLDAGNLAESEEYLALAKKADNKSAAVSLLEGDIALAKKETGVAFMSKLFTLILRMSRLILSWQIFIKVPIHSKR